MNSQEFAKDQSESEDLDEEAREAYASILSDSEAMTEDAQSYAYNIWFEHNEFSFTVEEKIKEVAEEYIR